MSRLPILVADSRHFGPRRFPPLYDFAAKNGVRIRAETSRAAWWERAEGYRCFADRLAPHRRVLHGLSLSELQAQRHREIDVFACARAEMLRLLWRRCAAGGAPKSAAETMAQGFAAAEVHEELLLCLAAAQDWVDFWHRLLDDRGPFQCVAVDRGRAIHSRTLLEVAACRGIRTFVTDRFSTGRHFFFEEQTSGGFGRTLLCDPDWCRRLVLPADSPGCQRVRAEMHRRLAPIRDAVTARPASEELAAPFDRPPSGWVLVLGRPTEAPSLLDPPLAGPSLAGPPPALCRRVVGGILDRTDLAVVFHGEAPVAHSLSAWRDTLPASRQARFRVAGTMPLDILLAPATLAVSLSAMLTLEACRAGLKPVQFGETAFRGKGFTHDFNGPDDFLDELAAGRIDGSLSLDEYRGFEDFLARLVLLHLVPEGEEGARKIAVRLAEPGHVPTLSECASGRECASGVGPRAPAWRLLAHAVANPTAARRLAATWPEPGRRRNDPE